MRSPRQLRRRTLPELGHQKKTEKKQRFKRNCKVFLSDPPSGHKPPLILRTRGTVSSHSPTFGLGAPCDRPEPCPTSVRRAGSGFYPGQALALGLSKAVPRGNKYDVQPAPRSSWRGVNAESPTPLVEPALVWQGPDGVPSPVTSPTSPSLPSLQHQWWGKSGPQEDPPPPGPSRSCWKCQTFRLSRSRVKLSTVKLYGSTIWWHQPSPSPQFAPSQDQWQQGKGRSPKAANTGLLPVLSRSQVDSQPKRSSRCGSQPPAALNRQP